MSRKKDRLFNIFILMMFIYYYKIINFGKLDYDKNDMSYVYTTICCKCKIFDIYFINLKNKVIFFI